MIYGCYNFPLCLPVSVRCNIGEQYISKIGMPITGECGVQAYSTT